MGNMRNPSAPRQQFIPRLEALEDRNCPSFIGVRGNTLWIIGDPTADTISIMDNGNGMVTGTLNGLSVTGTTISHIVVHSREGDDTLTYMLLNPLISPLHLQVDMGSGMDSATLDFSPGLMSSRLKVDFNGSRGDETLITRFGNITNSKVNFRADLGKGADVFDSTLMGNILDSSAVRFLVNGNKGDDTFGFHAANTMIDATSKLDLNLHGGTGKDTINVDYAGQVNGKLRLSAWGGPGNDTIDASVTLNSGSTGAFQGRMWGGPGHDDLTFDVFDNSGGMAFVDAFVNGGAGHDNIMNTPNVRVVG